MMATINKAQFGQSSIGGGGAKYFPPIKEDLR